MCIESVVNTAIRNPFAHIQREEEYVIRTPSNALTVIARG